MNGLLISAVPAITVSGQPYTVLTLVNDQEKFIVNVWNSFPTDFSLFKYYSLSNVKSNDKGNSCTLSCCTPSDVIPESLRSYIPQIPTKLEFESLCNKLAALMEESECEMFLRCSSFLYNRYREAPAAKKNHHAYPGGLLQHTYELLNIFNSIYSALPFNVDPFVVSFACLYHDYGKLYEYKDGDYTDYLFLQGHVHGSAFHVQQVLSDSDIPQTKTDNIVHCILAHHGKPEWGSLVPSTSEAFLVHKLDELSGIGVQYTIPGNSYSLSTKVIHL